MKFIPSNTHTRCLLHFQDDLFAEMIILFGFLFLVDKDNSTQASTLVRRTKMPSVQNDTY